MLAARGVTTVALNEAGDLVEHRPDGTSAVLVHQSARRPAESVAVAPSSEATRSGCRTQRSRQVHLRRAHPCAPLLPGSVFVNAEEIAKQRWPAEPSSAHAYDAAQIAADTRSKLIEVGRPFIAETVFSHPSKLDLVREAHDANHIVVLHVLLVPEDLAVQRVKYGGASRRSGRTGEQDAGRDTAAFGRSSPRPSFGPTARPSTTTNPASKDRGSWRK